MSSALPASLGDQLLERARTGELQKAMGEAIRQSCLVNEQLGLKPSQAELEVHAQRASMPLGIKPSNSGN